MNKLKVLFLVFTLFCYRSLIPTVNSHCIEKMLNPIKEKISDALLFLGGTCFGTILLYNVNKEELDKERRFAHAFMMSFGLALGLSIQVAGAEKDLD